MANTTNFGWETPDDTDLVKDGAAAIRTLGSAIDTSLVDLKGGTTGQVLAKASNTDMDFTWATDASGIPATIFDAKGDIIAASAADTAARLAVGANNTVLTADSSTATGLKWAAPAAGALTKISSNAFSNVASVTIDNCFTSTYTDYLVIINNIYAGTSTDDILMQLRYSTSTQATDYYGSSYLFPYTGSNTTIQSNASTSFQISNNIGSATYKSTGQIFFSRVGNVSEIASWRGQLLDEGDTIATHFAGKNNTARTYTGLLFKSSSSNITGNITIYGLEK